MGQDIGCVDGREAQKKIVGEECGNSGVGGQPAQGIKYGVLQVEVPLTVRQHGPVHPCCQGSRQEEIDFFFRSSCVVDFGCKRVFPSQATQGDLPLPNGNGVGGKCIKARLYFGAWKDQEFLVRKNVEACLV